LSNQTNLNNELRVHNNERKHIIMLQTTGRILKSDEVRIEGRFRLELGATGPTTPKTRSVGTAAPSVKILESRPEYALMELTCSCGRKSVVRCEYDDTSTAKSTQPTTKPDGTPNREPKKKT